jgi:hypothetical protein
MNSDMSARKYSPLWNKYRPAILKMMLAAADVPQLYTLMQHEVVSLDTKKKRGFDFILRVTNGKATNNIRESEIAQDLLNMLQQSPKGIELLRAHSYEITLDRQFKLHVTQEKPVVSEPILETNPK